MTAGLSGLMRKSRRVKEFDDDMVARYLEEVIVNEEGYEVRFKAGISVEVVWRCRAL